MGLTVKGLLSQIDAMPVSKAVAKGLRIAQSDGVPAFADWCRLELGGYLASNPAMNERVIVPEYRTVVGQHGDIYGRVLILPAELAFIGETRLRNGIEELETLARTRETVVIHDPHMCDLIRRHLDMDVYSFRFSSVHLTGILTAIREQLRESLAKIEGLAQSGATTSQIPDDEILQLKPNFHGIGIDLRAAWRRWRGMQ